jgi:lipoprotein NlpI
MRFNLLGLLFLPFMFLLSACQSTGNNNVYSGSNHNSNLYPLSIPVQIDYQDEVQLLRINQVLAQQSELDERERAILFYDRGIIYDRMGLGAHSRYDFTQAINIDPTFPAAYNTLGLYLLLAQSYDEAFEAFDSALELSSDMEYSYMHKAVGLYQVKRYSLASDEIETFYKLDENDPYRVLWRYIINSKIDPSKALQDLSEQQQPSDDKGFAWSIVDVINGNTTEKQFFERVSIGAKSNNELAQRLCEAYFYLAHWHKLSGNVDKAIYYFKLSTATNIHDFIEYKYALIELAAIQLQLQNELQVE